MAARRLRAGYVDVGHLVAIPGFRRLQDICESTRKHLAMSLIYGKAGIGKSTAANYFFDHLKGVRKVTFSAPPNVTLKSFARLLYQELIGHDSSATLYELQCDLAVELSSVAACVVMVDEVQRLGLDHFEFLRSLHDQPSSQFALIMVGGPMAWKVVQQYPMLRSRILHRLDFPTIPTNLWTEILPLFHDIYAGIDSEASELIANVSQGRFRIVAQITGVVEDILEGNVRAIDRTLIEAALIRMGVTQDAFDD